MIRESSPAMFVATAIISLGIGFGAATLIQRPAAPINPIVDANAWEETAPAAVTPEQFSFATTRTAETCDPWKVSDVAMEEVLDQMIRRGWRPPSQGDAIALLDTAQTTSLTATDPYAPMPSRRTWASSVSQSEDVATEEETIVAPAVATEPTAPPATTPEPPQPPPA